MGSFLHFIWEWVIVFFIFKMIILKGVANVFIKQFSRYVKRTDRTDAIWEHFQLQAAGHGHVTDDVLECGEENCAVFAAA